jgi:hypothetical protein
MDDAGRAPKCCHWIEHFLSGEDTLLMRPWVGVDVDAARKAYTRGRWRNAAVFESVLLCEGNVSLSVCARGLSCWKQGNSVSKWNGPYGVWFTLVWYVLPEQSLVAPLEELGPYRMLRYCFRGEEHESHLTARRGDWVLGLRRWVSVHYGQGCLVDRGET